MSTLQVKAKTRSEIFNNSVPKDVQEEFVRIIFKVYKDALTEVMHEGYEPEMAIDVLSHVRRSKLDSALYRLSRRFEDVNARMQSNVGHNCHHTVIASGDVIITASAVDTPIIFPRDAIFRGIYAGDSELAQMVFEINPETHIFEVLKLLPTPSERVYAMLLHGPSNRGLCGKPSFIQIGFPDQKCKFRLDKNIDLSKKFANVVSEMLAYETEQIPDKAGVKLNMPHQEQML